MRRLLIGGKHLGVDATLGTAWVYVVYVVSTLAALAGLFLPFGRQAYGCPPRSICLLFGAVADRTLAQVQAGAALLGLLSVALLLGLLTLVRPGRLLTLLGLPLSVAALALVSFEAATVRSWLSPWPQDPLPVNLEAGFYLATIGSACASLTALLLLVRGSSQPWKIQATRPSLGFAGAYLAAMAVGLAGILVPFVWEPFPSAQWSLAQGQDGPTLLVVALVALAVGGVTVIRTSTTMRVAQLILPLATLILIGLDAADPLARVLQLQPDSGSGLPLSFAPGFYLALISSATASLLALLPLVHRVSQLRRRGQPGSPYYTGCPV